MTIRSLPGGETTRAELVLKLARARQELDSKGTLEDPVSSQTGWLQDDLVSLEKRVDRYPQPTLGAMHSAATERAAACRTRARALAAGAFVAGLCTAAAAPGTSPLLFGGGLVATTGLTIASVNQGLHAGEARTTANDLVTWGRAFAS